MSVVISRAASLQEIAGEAAWPASPSPPEAHVGAITGSLSDARSRADASDRGRWRTAQFAWGRAADHLKVHSEGIL